MKKFLFILFFLALQIRTYAQQFSQYNTGTLYDSFENPAERSFTPDSSRKVAFNLFFPNFNLDATLTGHAQSALKNRAFLRNYNDDALTVDKQNLNRVNTSINAYAFMLKVYTSLNGNQELGIFAQSKVEARGIFSDESVQIVADNSKFNNLPHTDVFNTHYNYQAYHQFGITYREDVTDQFALGFKLSGLLGIVYNKVNINHSYITFDQPNDQAFLSLVGQYYASFEPGKFTQHDLLPSFKNPGASISVGASYLTQEKVKLQWNIKDLGFIHWNKLSEVGVFNNTGIIRGLSQPGVEDSIAKTAAALVQSNSAAHSFTSPTNAKAEFSAAKAYWIDSWGAKYTPTFILSKELFYTGFTGAMVNHLQFNNFIGTATVAYDDLHELSLGGQLMVKSPNAEFYIGCDRMPQTFNMVNAAYGGSAANKKAGIYSGANFFIGFSIKMGAVIEHQANASHIPMGNEDGFFKRFWGRVFKKDR